MTYSFPAGDNINIPYSQSPGAHHSKELEVECISVHFYHRFLMASDFASLNSNGKCHKN